MSDGWLTISRDLRRALVASGRPVLVVEDILADLAPVWIAVERTRITVDEELTWALLGVAADRARRRAHEHRVAPLRPAVEARAP